MKKRGFTIFFAVLVASLSLSVGLAIYDLLIRELALSQVATQSQYAIYAADMGSECALYWDSKYSVVNVNDIDGSAFATSSSGAGDVAASAQAYCNTQDITNGWTTVTTPTSAVTTFQILTGASSVNPCAVVTVTKNGNPSATTVVSHGYNTCAVGGIVRIERALQVSY